MTTGASNDIERATELARAMVTRYGMLEGFGFTAWEQKNSLYLLDSSSVNCSDATEERIDAEVIRITTESYAKAKEILSEHRDTLDKLAGALFEKETITGEEFMNFLRENEPEAARIIDEQARIEKEKAEQEKLARKKRVADLKDKVAEARDNAGRRSDDLTDNAGTDDNSFDSGCSGSDDTEKGAFGDNQ